MSVVVFQEESQAVHGFHVAGRSGSTRSRSRLGGSGWVVHGNSSRERGVPWFRIPLRKRRHRLWVRRSHALTPR